MTLRIVLEEEGGRVRFSLARPLHLFPGANIPAEQFFRTHAAILVGEASDMLEANGMLEDVAGK